MIGSQFVWAYGLVGQADKQQPEKVYSGEVCARIL